MRRVRLLLVAVVTLALLGALTSSAAAKTVWLCKPGKADNPCDVSLNTTLLSPTGKRLGVQRIKRPRPRCSSKLSCQPEKHRSRQAGRPG